MASMKVDYAAALTENSTTLGGTNDGNLPTLTATAVALTMGTDITAGTANGSLEDSAATNPSKVNFDNNMKEINTVLTAILADNVALRAAIREVAAKINAIVA